MSLQKAQFFLLRSSAGILSWRMCEDLASLCAPCCNHTDSTMFVPHCDEVHLLSVLELEWKPVILISCLF